MKKNYIPHILAAILLVGSALSIYFDVMIEFMGTFFVLFSFAKLLDLSGFKKAFSRYDILAKWFPVYGWIYPFIELFLGICYLFKVFLVPALLVTIFIMGFGSLGVSRAVKQKIQCACLGTKIGVPLTYVTLFEDLLMLVMASVLLFV